MECSNLHIEPIPHVSNTTLAQRRLSAGSVFWLGMSAFGMCFLGLLAMLIRNDYQCVLPAVLATVMLLPCALAAPLSEALVLTNVHCRLQICGGVV